MLQAATLHLDLQTPVAPSSPLLYGLMTEEINHAYDGGLYAELVQNRVFLDDENGPRHWSATSADSKIELDRSNPLSAALPVSLRLESASAVAGIANEGYWGIPVKPSTQYRASFYARAGAGYNGVVTVAMTNLDGSVTYAKATATALSDEWKEYKVTLTTDAKVVPTKEAKLTLTIDQPGTVWFNLVSLFPPTWKDRPNGLRVDLMQMLVDLKPKFLRFPGGNYLEGNTIATRFEWKKTLGPLTERPGHPCNWGYRSTDGMGLMEFLLWTEDMGAIPILGLYAGYSLGGEFVKPGPELEPYIQEALEEIEYVSGPIDSTWGARRAADGHPEPFPLTYVEIGNEDNFDKSGSYDGRFTQFYDAIRAKYPKLKIISSIGQEHPPEILVKSRIPDVYDEHYYRSTVNFFKMAPDHFDKYARTGPEIFVGEWGAYEEMASWEKGASEQARTPSLKAALGDAAWMTAMERNSDAIKMHCYAPLLVNVNPGASQWRPNLIGYDALQAYASPSYHAQALFSQNHGDEILKGTLSDLGEKPIFSSTTRDAKTGRVYLKIVNGSESAEPMKIHLVGGQTLAGNAVAITLSNADWTTTNSITELNKIAPVTTTFKGVKENFDYSLPPYSITVLQLNPLMSPAPSLQPKPAIKP